jgi:hypothetical protein
MEVASLEKESKEKWANWKTMPNVLTRENWDNEYYLNLTEEDIRECIDIDAIGSNGSDDVRVTDPQQLISDLEK